jgi:PAS domain S-box-containing protein
MQAALGITEADVPTLRIEGSLIAPTDRQEARATIDALQRGEITGPVRFERAIVRGDGRQRWLEMTFAMVDHRGR